ncbi:MAG: toll/interleukin-1 receptor domain-containing protein [Bacteroidia bacterium]
MAPQVFVSYSHADAAQKAEFVKYLRMLEMTGKAKLWTDGELVDGMPWDQPIKDALAASEIVLVLVTMNTLVSNYISRVELSGAYEKYDQGKGRVICVIMDDCPWENLASASAKATAPPTNSATSRPSCPSARPSTPPTKAA